MRLALDPGGHRVPRTKPTCLLHTWRPHRRRPFALSLHLHQHQSSRNLHLQYLAKNQSTQCCQSLITQGSDHPPVLEPHMVLRCIVRHNTLIKLKNLPYSCLDANHSSNFETLKLNSVLAMSTNISLEELLGIKNNYQIYFGCTGIHCFH
jgi:hypothetical protein